ncbi:hypothetical protein KBA73_03700 [Patescibacteria group bacterium]|nr:hypothetical protein [Patescibacteria group bacterium]
MAEGMDLSRFTWLTSREPPPFPTQKHAGLVLDVTLGSLRDTFEFAWRLIVANGKRTLRDVPLRTDSKHLRQRSSFRSWTLAWRTMSFTGEGSESEIEEEATGCSALFALAEHPKLVRQGGVAWLISDLMFVDPRRPGACEYLTLKGGGRGHLELSKWWNSLDYRSPRMIRTPS